MDREFSLEPMLDNELLPDDLFTSQVAQIRAKENTMLSDQDLNSLMQSRNFEECFQLLLDKGWGPVEKETPEELLSTERDKMWELMHSLCSDKELKAFDIFLLSTDFHNLKAAIKESYVQKEVPNVYIEGGTIPIATLRKAAAENEYAALPLIMMRAAEEAREVLFHTGDSQLCDVIIDRAALQSIYQAGKETKNKLLSDYAELKVAAANINIAVRACKTNKDVDFLQRAFCECESISAQRLAAAARNGLDSIYEYLESTSYADAIEALRESPAAFDRWCDDRMMRLIKPQKYNAFTISPLAAYVLAKENEIKSVRMILSGKLNHLSEEQIRERLRESYV